MGIFNLRRKKQDTEERSILDTLQSTNPVVGWLNFGNAVNNYSNTKNLKLSTVYRCVNLLSDSIASIPIMPYTYKDNWKYEDYESGLYNLLNVQPNNLQSAFIFKKMIVQLMLLKGNAFVLIERDTKGVKKLKILPNDSMEVLISNDDIKYKDSTTGTIYDKSQIIHLINFTLDGIRGISTISYASTSLEIAYNSDIHASNFFDGGGNLSGILRPVAGANISPTKAQTAKEKFVNALNNEVGGKSNGVVVLDSGYEYQPITVSPKDSQLLETRQFNVIDICRFFNVPPTLAFSETGKYSTAEQQQIDFLTNSLTPLIEKMENELFRKLYLKSEWDIKELRFNTDNLLRLDATTRASYFTQLHNIGAITSNEIREKINAQYPVVGGNRAFVNTNVQPIDNIIYDNKNNNQIDNKAK